MYKLVLDKKKGIEQRTHNDGSFICAFYRATISVMVKPLLELVGYDAEEKSGPSKFFSVKNAGCLGLGNVPSFPNMKTTDDMFGLSSGLCCTHNKPTSIDLKTSDGLLDSAKLESMSSIDFPSLCILHA